jgi:hypothetical protein
LSRASSSLDSAEKQDVDGRVKRGHDAVCVARPILRAGTMRCLKRWLLWNNPME